MTRIHDMGGRFGDGPVPRETDESRTFAKDWHGRALALTVAAGALGKWNIDASRHMRECLPPVDYARFGYYEKWLAGLANLLVEHGIASAAEIAAGRSAGPAADDLAARRLDAARVEPALRSGGPSARHSLAGRPLRSAPGSGPAPSPETGCRMAGIQGFPPMLPAVSALSCCIMARMSFPTAMRISKARRRSISTQSALPPAICGSMPNPRMMKCGSTYGKIIWSRHEPGHTTPRAALRTTVARRGVCADRSSS